MLADLEQRLATVLGNELPPPFAGRVRVPPASPPGAGPAVLVSVSHAVPLPSDFGSVRFEAVPTPPERQRVVRLRCTIDVVIRPAQASNRDQVVDGVDALLYLLDDSSFRSAAALIQAADQGFALSSLTIQDATPELRADDEAPPHVTLQADGLFWPVGTAAETGVEIVEARVRQVNLPLGVSTLPARIPAGGAPVELRFAVDRRGTMRLRADGLSTDPFGPLAVRLLGAEGGPGAGNLSGGAAGPDGSRLIDVADGELIVTYTPPADPAEDRVVLNVVQGAGVGATLGLEIARVTLRVEAGA